MSGTAILVTKQDTRSLDYSSCVYIYIYAYLSLSLSFSEVQVCPAQVTGLGLLVNMFSVCGCDYPGRTPALH